MTPAIDLVKKKRIEHKIHQYQHDSKSNSYGLEAAELLEQDSHQVFKTLLISLNGEAKNLAVAIIPVANKLDLKSAAKALKVKKVEMADSGVAEKITGYIVGGISPLGQKKSLPTLIDDTATAFDTLFISAGRRGLELELSPQDLAALTRATFAHIGK
ncbi:MAG: Cys-tRNA(Pro) deacylase [Aliivibrio sp.]|uniref:Cys-tRNA(Pro) deacylase n=1 Tax=Aliivibrio sp. TaxID=1872443 RepID=UPI001A560E15|nr:Cys-tRNA(Pro) deacylase [Aliivibrio sp.]